MAVDLKKILNGIGIKDDQLPKDDDAAIDYDAVVGTLNTALRTAVENDSTFMKKVNDASYGRATGEVQRKLIKKFGLKFENPEDEKDLDKVLELAHTTASANANKTAQQLQQQLAERTSEFEKIGELHKKDIEVVRGEVRGMKRKFNLDNTITKELSALNDPAKKNKLSSGIEVALPFMRQQLEEGYLIQFDEPTNALTVHPLGHPELKVMDGTKTLTLSDIVAKVAETHKIIVPIVAGKRETFTFTPNGGGQEGEGDRQRVTANSEGLQKITEATTATADKGGAN